MSSSKKSVLWIDPHLEYRSPTMRHLLYALPRLRAEGWDVKAWCLRSDAPRDQVEHVFFQAPKWLGPFELLYFALIVNLYGFWRWVLRRPRPADVLHASCGTYLGADLISVHFMNCIWARMQIRLGFTGWRDIARYPFVLMSAVVERLQWWSPTLRTALAVSDSVADEVRHRVGPKVEVRSLPNSYDESRFHPEVRTMYRHEMRASLGYGPDDHVFCFVSAGHHRRKGFWLAVDALNRVRKTLPGERVRFLVVGGTPATVDALQTESARRFPGANEWMRFVGMQREVEKYYAASDAFLFPSYFEAFCLAEIEAAACGLPLLVTPHCGTEMILRDGSNGIQLSFEPGEMSRQIQAYIEKGRGAFECKPGGGLTRNEYASRILEEYQRCLRRCGDSAYSESPS